MANLSVENLSRIVQGGNTEQLFTGGIDSPLRGADSKATGADGKNFMDILKTSMEKVNTNQAQADQAVRELVSGRSKNIHETLLAVERADSSLKLMMQVRNKILEAYKEVMRMQV